MEVIKFKYNNLEYYGTVNGNDVFELINFDFSKEFFETGFSVSKCDIEVISPIKPSKIIGLALNNKKLVGPKKKYDEPLIFLKSPTSLTFSNSIGIPKSNKVWVEVEIGLVIKKSGKKISKENAKNYIFGHLICNDMTMENAHNRDHHLARSKSLDGFCPSNSSIFTDINTDCLIMKTFINGTNMQNGNSKDRILNDFECIELVSKFITLEKGDLILTGTVNNAMNCIVKSGDEVKMIIEQLGDFNFKIK